MMAYSKKGMQVRWMARRDLEAVASIESKCFTKPLCQDVLEGIMCQRNTVGFVVTLIDQITGENFIAGYIIYHVEKDYLKVRRLVIHPNCRRIGVGKELLSRILKKLNKIRPRMEVVLREGNLEAQLFLRSLNFKAIEIIKNKYKDTSEDGYVMSYSVPAKIVHQGAS